MEPRAERVRKQSGHSEHSEKGEIMQRVRVMLQKQDPLLLRREGCEDASPIRSGGSELKSLTGRPGMTIYEADHPLGLHRSSLRSLYTF